MCNVIHYSSCTHSHLIYVTHSPHVIHVLEIKNTLFVAGAHWKAGLPFSTLSSSCYLYDRCTRQSECNTASSEWVSDTAESCPVISSANPSIIYIKVVDSLLRVFSSKTGIKSISVTRLEVLIYI